MLTSSVTAQVSEKVNPILPSTNETLWGAILLLLVVVVAIVSVTMIARYFGRLRRSAEQAATHAGAAEREIVALRRQLHEGTA